MLSTLHVRVEGKSPRRLAGLVGNSASKRSVRGSGRSHLLYMLCASKKTASLICACGSVEDDHRAQCDLPFKRAGSTTPPESLAVLGFCTKRGAQEGS